MTLKTLVGIFRENNFFRFLSAMTTSEDSSDKHNPNMILSIIDIQRWHFDSETMVLYDAVKYAASFREIILFYSDTSHNQLNR